MTDGRDGRPTSAGFCISSCADRERWRGPHRPRRLHLVDGLEWDARAGAEVWLPDPPGDLTAGDALRLVVESSCPSAAVLELRVECAGSSGSFVGRVPLDFRGLRRVVIPRSAWTVEVAASGDAPGWDRVGAVRARVVGDPPDGARVAIAELHLVEVRGPGPLLRDDELLAALDPARMTGPSRDPADVADHLRRRDLSAWPEFGTSSTSSSTSSARHARDDSDDEGEAARLVDEASAVARGELTIVGVRHEFPGGEIDWSYNPTRHLDGVDFNRQWEQHLNRMDFWSVLAKAHRRTGDPEYARAWARQLRGFLRRCPWEPEPRIALQSSQWSTLRCATRIASSWPDAFRAFRGSGEVSDRDLVDFLESVVEHGRHLRRHHHRGANNHQALELHGLHTLGCLFPELREAAEWRRYAAATLAAAVDRIFGPDGFTRELSSSYHKLSLLSFVGVLENAARFARETPEVADEIPSNLRARLEQAFDACLRVMAPDGKLPPVNDSSRPSARGVLARGAPLFPGRPEFAWAASRGRRGDPPRWTSAFLGHAGLAVLRSGWEGDANGLVFDVGPLGVAHQHQDKLSVALWARGRELLYDGGGGAYESGPLRDYAVDTASHNTVLVDGLGQRRSRSSRRDKVSKGPIDARFESTPDHDFAAGVYSGPYGGGSPLAKEPRGERIARHRRRVLFVKPDVFLILDDLEPRDRRRHRYEARWHLATTRTALDEASGAVETRDEGRPNLLVLPLRRRGLRVRAVVGQREPEILGVHVRKHGRDPEDATTVVHEATGRGRRRLWTLLLPLAPGESNPVRTVRGRFGGVDVLLGDGRVWRIRAGRDGVVSFEDRGPDGRRIRAVRAGASR